jgi:hypothetical protein
MIEMFPPPRESRTIPVRNPGLFTRAPPDTRKSAFAGSFTTTPGSFFLRNASATNCSNPFIGEMKSLAPGANTAADGAARTAPTLAVVVSVEGVDALGEVEDVDA